MYQRRQVHRSMFIRSFVKEKQDHRVTLANYVVRDEVFNLTCGMFLQRVHIIQGKSKDGIRIALMHHLQYRLHIKNSKDKVSAMEETMTTPN